MIPTKNVSYVGRVSRGGDPRQHRDWFLNHLDEIQADIDSNDVSPVDEMFKLNKDLNIDVDFKSIIQRNILD